MEKKDDFASLLDAAGRASGDTRRTSSPHRLRSGQEVSGRVVQIGAEDVFIDIGARTEARMSRADLIDSKGTLTVKLGDSITANVVSDNELEGPLLAWTLGRSGMGHAELERAQASGMPVEGVVRKVTKGGLEVAIGDAHAFCPASQIERGYVQDLSVYQGQTLRFKVTEVRDGGRSIVVSRRALLEAEQEQLSKGALERLHPGMDVEGSVTSLQKYGAFVDIGGVEGLIHISELASGRVDRVEDMLSVGERVTVRVLGVESTPTGARIKLSLRALKAVAEVAPSVDEVLTARVSRHLSGGIVVDTAKGSGFVPARELGLPHGADHRRVLPIGKDVQVVLVSRDQASGRLTFSVARVAGVEERLNYTEFSKAAERPVESASELGSLGELLRRKLGIEAPARAQVLPNVSQGSPSRPEAKTANLAVEAAAPAKREQPLAGQPEIARPSLENSVPSASKEERHLETYLHGAKPSLASPAKKPAPPKPKGAMPVGVVRRDKR